MANAMEGIMGLPQSTDPAAGTTDQTGAAIQSYAQNNPQEFNQQVFDTIAEQDPQTIAMLRQELQGLQLSVSELNALRDMIQQILNDPANYAEYRAQLIEQGLDEEDLPLEFDAAFFQMFATILSQIQGTPDMPEPQAFAEGGLATLKPVASMLAEQGRYGDSMLAHITPQEAMMLKRMGGSGTINPVTGLPEFFIKKIFKAAKKVVKSVTKVTKKILKNPIVRTIATIAVGMYLGPLIASTSFGAAIGGVGVAGVTAGLSTAGVSLLSGASLKDSLKAGLTSGVLAAGGAAAFGVPDSLNPNIQQAGVQPSGVTTQGTGAPVSGSTEMVPLAPGTDAMGVPIPQADLGNYVNQGNMSFDPNMGFLTPSEVMTQANVANTPMNMASYGPTTSNVLPTPAASFSTTAPTGGVATLPQAPAVNVPPAAPSIPTPPAATPPTFSSTLSDMGNQISQGNFLEAAETGYDRFLSPSTNIFTGTGNIPTPSVPSYADAYTAIESQRPGMSAAFYDSAAKDAVAQATAAAKAAAPGMGATLMSYAPMAAAGTGIAALGGAFTPEEPPEVPAWAQSMMSGPTGYELYEQDPSKYALNWGGTNTQYADLYNQGFSGYGSQANPYAYAPSGYRPVTYAAQGGEMQSFPRMNGHIQGPGTATSDSVPAMLSDGEFVMTAEAVRNMGNGSRRHGAKKMYALMKSLENRGMA